MFKLNIKLSMYLLTWLSRLSYIAPFFIPKIWTYKIHLFLPAELSIIFGTTYFLSPILLGDILKIYNNRKIKKEISLKIFKWETTKNDLSKYNFFYEYKSVINKLIEKRAFQEKVTAGFFIFPVIFLSNIVIGGIGFFVSIIKNENLINIINCCEKHPYKDFCTLKETSETIISSLVAFTIFFLHYLIIRHNIMKRYKINFKDLRQRCKMIEASHTHSLLQ